MTTFGDWLKINTSKLKNAGISSARLDCLILLEDATGKDRAWFLAHPNYIFQDQVLETAEIWCDRRAKHEPLAYIRGKSEFYGREFKVTPATLQPRPETETMIDLLLKITKSPPYKDSVSAGRDFVICDVGTGSGAIAITVKLECPEAKVYATEINQDALKIAKENAKNLKADIKFYNGNLLGPLSSIQSPVARPLIVLANLPYVPDSHTINQAAMQEPKVAIFGGEDGLNLYREMFAQISNLKSEVSLILTESLPFQHETLAQIAKTAGYELQETKDFIQLFTKING